MESLELVTGVKTSNTGEFIGTTEDLKMIYIWDKNNRYTLDCLLLQSKFIIDRSVPDMGNTRESRIMMI